jgi:hypothetical protein
MAIADCIPDSDRTPKGCSSSLDSRIWSIPDRTHFLHDPPRLVPCPRKGMYMYINAGNEIANSFARKVIQDAENNSQAVEPFILLGLLANYNKFEFQNPYRLRLDDFVNDNTIRQVVYSVGQACCNLRDEYVAIQDDTPEAWGIGNALGYFGLGSLKAASRPATPGEDAQKEFSELPSPAISILLATYDFVDANKLFCHNLVTLAPETKGSVSPLSGFLSLSSYLFQHAHRSSRATLYTYLTLFILQILVEDQVLMKRLCSDDSKMTVRLCRQRAPHLPLVKGERISIVYFIEVAMDCINHNLRKRLDVDLYLYGLPSTCMFDVSANQFSQCTGILIRIISYLSRSRTRLNYHWAELWRSLLSFIRFLTTYAPDLQNQPSIDRLANSTVNLIALSLSSGEAFLPDAAAYDDLFYKLVETGDHLTKFRDAYNLSAALKTPSTARDDIGASGSSIDTLLSVSEHYHSLLESEGKKGSAAKNLSPKEVSKIITQGYESLSIQAKDGLDRWEKFREADYKSELKRVARAAVADAKELAEVS